MKKLLIVLVLIFIAAAPLISVAQEQADFVPLTNLPGIEGAATSDTLPSFFNNIYKLCIGAAAVIAILQIMRAGALFMFNKGSVAHNEKGKSLIMNSILGLLLVLSPAIVFGIINPDILDLKLDFSTIKPSELGDAYGGSGSFNLALWTRTGDRAAAKTQCEKDGGKITYTCSTDGKSGRTVGVSETCKEGETSYNICLPVGTAPIKETACENLYESITAGNAGEQCVARNGYQSIPLGCCAGASDNAVCCGKPKTTPPPGGAVMQ